MISVYNSIQEIKVIILMLLDCSLNDFVSADMIAGLDFITVYGKEFGVSDYNLHWDNRFKYSELPSRREVVQEALKVLARNGLVDVSLLNEFGYQINDLGEGFVGKLNSDYASKYTEIAGESLQKISKR